jgi:hypothetical protein
MADAAAAAAAAAAVALTQALDLSLLVLHDLAYLVELVLGLLQGRAAKGVELVDECLHGRLPLAEARPAHGHFLLELRYARPQRLRALAARHGRTDGLGYFRGEVPALGLDLRAPLRRCLGRE